MHPAPDERPTRSPYGVEGTGSALAKSYEDLHRIPEMGDWAWMVGPDGYRPESGRPYMYGGHGMNPQKCESTNRSCYCHQCQFPMVGGSCVCERHKDQAPIPMEESA